MQIHFEAQVDEPFNGVECVTSSPTTQCECSAWSMRVLSGIPMSIIECNSKTATTTSMIKFNVSSSVVDF